MRRLGDRVGRAGRAAFRAGIAAGVLAALGSFPVPSAAFELEEPRFQIHGFAEIQLRAIARNYEPSDGLDLTQWYNVLNLEAEWDIAPAGWGPFAYVAAFGRVEVRYDCVWTRGCGTFRSADTYGDRANVLPDRLSDGERVDFEYGGATRIEAHTGALVLPDHRPGGLLASSLGPLIDLAPQPAQTDYLLESFQDFRFGSVELERTTDGHGGWSLTGWLPKNFLRSVATISDRANPLNENDINPGFPVVDALGNPLLGPQPGLLCAPGQQCVTPPFPGFGALPFRPAPVASITDPLDLTRARGNYYPEPGLNRVFSRIDSFGREQNFRQSELAWNRGSSQQDEKELKELYLDVELLDGALWGRIGKQTIVWGKTELFRNQDQFNPQDLALASLPSLEESRIPLWAARLVYSLYDVGPLEDVRLEAALLYDQFEPADVGDCGEPYAVDVICWGIAEGLFQHGITGFGIAGFAYPDDPWEDTSGIEAGGRIEFRWSRYSFAITNFYGFSDFPVQRRYQIFERNVDTDTGRPRFAGTREPCDPEGSGDVAGCLGLFSANPADPAGTIDRAATEAAALSADPAVQRRSPLLNHSAQQQVFSFICGGTVGSALINAFSRQLLGSDTARLCVSTLFNAGLLGANGSVVSRAFLDAMAGNSLFLQLQKPPPERPLIDSLFVDLNHDPAVDGPFSPTTLLSGVLTDEQEALLGCGPYYGTSCDGAQSSDGGGLLLGGAGMDLLNAEASVLLQSFTGFEGAFTENPRDTSFPQPGTVSFVTDPRNDGGGPVATRNIGTTASPVLVMLPGSRGPIDAGYDARIDGCVDQSQGGAAGSSYCSGQATLRHPFTDDVFRSEMAALSWNLFMASVVPSTDAINNRRGAQLLGFTPTWTLGDPDVNEDGVVNELDDINLDGIQGGADDAPCSLDTPLRCNLVAGLLNFAAIQNPLVTSQSQLWGRRDFRWHAGANLYLEYPKNNYLGASMDFAEDRTQTNWSFEFTWVNDVQVSDAREADIRGEIDQYNLTISVDRPTFIRFLNGNRTFFFNVQTFLQYLGDYRKTMPIAGPINVLQTFSVFTGYFQDRMNPGLTLVYDFGTNSGAVLPSVDYRFSEAFRITFGLASFFGRLERTDMERIPTAPVNRVGNRRFNDIAEQGLSPVRNRDEIFLRLRYTF